ncbi:hypothetical protein [Azospirillum largimobile]
MTLMFVLVKEATIRKRLDLDAVIRQWETRFPAMIVDVLKGG